MTGREAGRVAVIGNFPPRRCGIATFTHDLVAALEDLDPARPPLVVAVQDRAEPQAFAHPVAFEVTEGEPASFAAAGEWLNGCGAGLVLLQHEYGIFGGPAGADVLELVRRLEIPLVTALHTVLEEPNAEQRAVMEELIARSDRLIVMAERGRTILRDRWAVEEARIAVIPHGVVDRPFVETDARKRALGYGDRALVLTFGLLGPGKGIETMIDALPTVVARVPDALYVVLGATHPNLVRHEGERYRQSLIARAEALGLRDHVAFVDRFVDDEELAVWLEAADVYVAPYPNAAQITSGTLARSFAMGKPIVSTPFWHASELLADGKGLLVPFGASGAMGAAVADVLEDAALRQSLRQRAYAAGRWTTWPVVARSHAKLFAEVVGARAERPRNVLALSPGTRSRVLPAIALDHLEAMTDSAGLLQHAIFSIADRRHGYCLDDNARALQFLAALRRVRPWGPRETRLALVYAAFVEHAWNEGAGRFRNFMDYGRNWLEEVGADDAHARAIWALGSVAELASDRQLAAWATGLIGRAALPLAELGSPRAWALGLLGLNAYLRGSPGDTEMAALRQTLAGRLASRYRDASDARWPWFEDRLAYDNARLPEALIDTGLALGDAQQIETGLHALDWLMRLQTAPGGHFRPVGTDSFGRDRLPPLPFDQQAIEAAASVSAALAAYRATGLAHWRDEAGRAFGWFLGANDLKLMMAEPGVGAGFDGLHPDRRNANQGAESTLAYLVALGDMHALSAAAGSPGRLGQVA
jgi:glycosyltransferase involved in cell wall biosynthesis